MNTLASMDQLRASFLRWSLFLVPLIVLLGFLAGQLGSPNTLWFQQLEKPASFPPPEIFGIAWSVLYAMIGFAIAFVASAWGARGRGIAIAAFVVHFAANLAWTPTFFGMQDMQSALWVAAFMFLSLVVVIALFWRVRRVAALLLLPYLAWVGFATFLNYEFIEANPDGGHGGIGGAAERVTL